jgi:hypothetical protein
MMKFESGQSGNSSSTAKSQHDLRNLAREQAHAALALIIKVLGNPKAVPQARIAAARSLLERGWGDDLQEDVRLHRHDALKVLIGVMNDSGISLQTRLAAADILLDYGGGESKPHVVPTVARNTQRWLDEIREIRAQFAADQPSVDH